MTHTAETPSVPMEVPEVDVHFCEFCGHGIESCSDEEFDPKDAESTLTGYVHKHCILPQIAAKLTTEERFQVVKLAYALQIIGEISDDLIQKLDREVLINTYLSGLKEKAEEQLNELNDELGTFGEDLILVRTSAVGEAYVALSGAVIDARIDLQGAKDSGLAPVFIDMKSDRLNFLIKTRSELREATA